MRTCISETKEECKARQRQPQSISDSLLPTPKDEHEQSLGEQNTAVLHLAAVSVVGLLVSLLPLLVLPLLVLPRAQPGFNKEVGQFA